MTNDQWIEKVLKEIQNENDGKSIDYNLPGDISKKLQGYTSMGLDLETCHGTLLALSKIPHHDKNAIIASALFHAFVVLYGKCFTENRIKYPKLNPKDVFKDQYKDFIIIHNEVMYLRNNFVAHHGNTNNEYIFPYLKVSLDGNDVRVCVRQTKKMGYTPNKLHGYLGLTIYLRQVVEFHKSKCTEKIVNHIEKTYELAELLEYKIAGPNINIK